MQASEDIWRMAYVGGPEGIIVALAQRIERPRWTKPQASVSCAG